MAQYSKIASGFFTSTGVAKFLSLPFIPDSIEILNKSQYNNGSANPGVAKKAQGFSEDTAGTGYVTINTSTFATSSDVTITSGGFSFISAGTPTYGPVLTGTSVSQATPAVVAITAHGLVTGDSVLIYGTTGMLQIAGQVYKVTVVDANNFSIGVDSSGFAAAASVVKAKKVLYPDLYIPFNCDIISVSKANPCVVTTSVAHNFVVGQEVSFVIPSAWGMVELNAVRCFVTAVSASTITLNINSSAFTTFAYPTSAVAGAGTSFPQVYSVGDSNTGYSGPTVPNPQTIPGAFAANTRQGVIIGIGNGTTVLHANNDVIRWRAYYPDLVLNG